MWNKTVILLTLCFSFAYADNVLMKESDVKRIMDEIFSQHVQKKEMTPELYRESVENYLENADVDRIYLLKSEVAPYYSLSNNQLRGLIRQYNKGDFRFFKHLDTLIQNAYGRARNERAALAPLAASFVYEVIKSDERYPDGFETWAPSEEKLKARQKEYFKNFIEQWVHRYGKARAESQPKEVLVRYDHDQSFKENQYLTLGPEGQLLPVAERENLFALHLLKAFAASLDAHTKVYDPSEATSMRLRLESGYKGIGLVLGSEGGELIVQKVIEESAADKNGQIQTGDALMEINSKPLKGLNYQEAVEILRSEPGDQVDLSFVRGAGATKKKFKVTLKKEPLEDRSGRLKYFSEKFGNGVIGVIKLDAFYRSDDGISSEEDVKSALAELDKQNLRGLVLDLRDNRGGYLNQAVKVAGLFITNGVVVVSRYATGEEKIYRDTDGKTYYDGPLVVLVSKLTASAAEIVAQALQDYGVALIVGDEHTYGKGTIQSQTVTGDEKLSSYFKVTVGKYYTVSGKTPQLEGVKADIVAPGPLSKRQIGEAFLQDTLPSDIIAANYNDELKDVDPTIKSWYVKYYLPTLQPQEGIWKNLEERLRANSLYRLQNNSDYQAFLRDPQAEYPQNKDPQLKEAVDIVKDMIYLESKDHHTKNVDLN